MPWFIMDYERDTGHLSLEEDCCYRRLIDALWKRDTKPLPDDDLVLARIIRLDLETWTRLKPAMIPFFTITPKGWTNKKVSETWLWVVAKMKADQERGKKATEARLEQRHEQRDVDNSNPNPHSH